MSKKSTKEIRSLAIKELRVARSDDSASGIGTLSGYAAVFDSWSDGLGFFREKIQKGAFEKVLKTSDCRALINHDPSMVIGRQSAGTLRLSEDETGLYMEVDLPDTQHARDLMVSVERGDINQQSFGFEVEKDAWSESSDQRVAERTILEVRELFDVSIVTFPAYPDTSVAKRSLDAFRSANEPHQDDQAALDDEFDNFEMDLIAKEIIGDE